MNLVLSISTFIFITSPVLSGDHWPVHILDIKVCVFPEPEPQDIISRFMLELNVMKNGLLNLLPGRGTNILYPEELNISVNKHDYWRRYGHSVHRNEKGGLWPEHRETDDIEGDNQLVVLQ